jgi:ComF family protein
LCGDALAAWRVLCLSQSRCARCRRAPPAFDAGRAAGHYDGALRDLVHAFKFDGRRRLARVLGERMREAGASLLEDAACVVPVPLHPWRRLTRGFNQAHDLAVTLGPPVVAALWRRRATASQSGLAATVRRRNVRGAFCMAPLVSRRTLALRIEGRLVVLVDDVVTTGATLDACARVLKGAGAREVRILTAARATLRR